MHSKRKILIILFALLFINCIFACSLLLSGCSEEKIPSVSGTKDIYLSHAGGVYSAEFNLFLAPVHEGDTLYYTLDCSTPSRYSAVYDKKVGIPVSDNTATSAYPLMNGISDTSLNGTNPGCGTVVRVVEVDETGKTVASATVTYIVDPDYCAMANEAKVPVVCLTAPKSVWLGKQGSVGFYNDVTNDDRKERMELEYYDIANEETFAFNTQVKLGGNWTKVNIPKRTFNLNWKWADADKTVKNPKLSKLGVHIFGDRLAQNGGDLTDLTAMRLHCAGNCFELANYNDALSQSIANQSPNLSTTGARGCLLFLNGEFWGFYYMREHYSDDYFKANFGVDNDNVIYADRTYSPDATAKYSYDIKSYNETDEYIMADGVKYTHLAYAHRCLDELYAALTLPSVSYGAGGEETIVYGQIIRDYTNDAATYERLSELIDIDGLIDMVLTEAYVGNWDFFYNNMRIWRVADPSQEDRNNPYADGKWRFCLHDLDFSLESPAGTAVGGSLLDAYAGLNGAHTGGGVFSNLVTCLLAAPMTSADFRARMSERAEAIVGYFAYAEGSVAQKLFRHYKTEYETYMTREYARWNGRTHTRKNYLRCRDAVLTSLRERAITFRTQVESFVQAYTNGLPDASSRIRITDSHEVTSFLYQLSDSARVFDLSGYGSQAVYAPLNKGLQSEAFSMESGVSFTFTMRNSRSDWDNILTTDQVRINTGTVSYVAYTCDWYEIADDLYVPNGPNDSMYWSKLTSYSPFADNWDRDIVVTVNCIEDRIEFYRNGILTYRYGADSACSYGDRNMTMCSVYRSFLSDCLSVGFTFTGNGMDQIGGLYVATGLSESDALLLYQNLSETSI